MARFSDPKPKPWKPQKDSEEISFQVSNSQSNVAGTQFAKNYFDSVFSYGGSYVRNLVSDSQLRGRRRATALCMKADDSMESAGTDQNEQFKLIYFDLYGRAEPIRMALWYAKVSYEDSRVAFDKFAELKPKLPYG